MTKKKVKKVKKVRTQEDLQLIELVNKSVEICRDCLEAGSPPTHEVIDFQAMVWQLANSRGFVREDYYSDFK